MTVTEEYVQNYTWILEIDCIWIGTWALKIHKHGERIHSNFRRVVTYGEGGKDMG